MAANLAATHLVRRFGLFAFTALFLLTTLRAGHALWRFAAVEGQGAVLDLFLHGLRFDIALVGAVCLVPVTLGSALAMFGPTRGAARVLIVGALMAGLVLMLLAELLTPWFLAEAGVRPGVPELLGVQDPLGAMIAATLDHPIVAGLGVLLGALVAVAFWARLEVPRLLRFPLAKGSGAALALVGGAACALAIWSGPVPGSGPLSPADARVTDAPIVNELVMNSAWKALATVPGLPAGPWSGPGVGLGPGRTLADQQSGDAVNARTLSTR